MTTTSLVWFRRDLRNEDHAALAHALARGGRVYCAFVFDRDLLDVLEDRQDRRVAFIHASLRELDEALDAMARAAGSAGSGLIVCHGRAEEEIVRLASELSADTVYANRDYEPVALARDARVGAALAQQGRGLVLCKDQVIFECDEILTQAGSPFSVFTPYRNAWHKALTPAHLAAFGMTGAAALAPPPRRAMPTLDALGFSAVAQPAGALVPGMRGARARLADFAGRLAHYHRLRDFPAVKGVSYLSVDLRFGTVSIRQLARLAGAGGGQTPGQASWLNELVWREFYQMILWQHPRVVEEAFLRKYRALVWDENPAGWQAWCEGRTGYPVVDAGMRQLLATGYMHNRLRMIVASFLVKDLGIDWRRGERFFARHLNDYDLAANNGGWQWAASTGCDAQPYFRLFNPVTQSQKFDPDGRFIRRYVPELARLPDKGIHAPWTMRPVDLLACGVTIGRDYPLPVVDHAQARAATLKRFGMGGQVDGQQ